MSEGLDAVIYAKLEFFNPLEDRLPSFVLAPQVSNKGGRPLHPLCDVSTVALGLGDIFAIHAVLGAPGVASARTAIVPAVVLRGPSSIIVATLMPTSTVLPLRPPATVAFWPPFVLSVGTFGPLL